MFKDKSILVTGGTGSFGHAFIERLLTDHSPKRIIIYSRDEYKQFLMENEMRARFSEKAKSLRFFIGDVRDGDRMRRACEGVDFIVHAAALKQVPACEYNPLEAIKTNIDGATNVINAALDCGVSRVVALSTDKAVNPINLYGGTKLVSDKLFVAANSYAGSRNVRFSVVRYGNVAGSRGSVIPFFKKLIHDGEKTLPITDTRMTRFWISLDEGVDLVIKAMAEANGGETFISKIPSFKITDLAEAILPGCEIKEVGIREGEKLHEIMISAEDSLTTYEYDNHYIIYPHYTWWGEEKIIPGGEPVRQGFEYSSGNNAQWLSVEELRQLITDMHFE
ncbi:MAG TPA: UDP-N-acetylglucosamine 4,6-dehydratase (inverting) [Clostridiaceae bacterium]|nr:UDP-N-acetylglucosamine 4,6-dehydratase (inverting) [Clostridiaceae bacterium]